MLSPAKAQKVLTEIEVGTPHQFVVAGAGELVAATCQFVGEHVFVFVEDRQWDTNGGSILQSHVDVLGELFDQSTPVDDSKGFFELCTGVFGDPPDVDGYERIFLLILDIPDPRFVGFFDARVAEHEVPELRRDILYVDAMFVRRQAYLARGTIAHELQHLIHWGHDEDEEVWLNEGLSGYAEELTGFPEADPTVVEAFLQRPSIGLTEWENQPYHYGSSYLFSSFLAERYGHDLIRTIVAESRNGRGGIDAAFSTTGFSETFKDVWSQWVLGNYASEDEKLTYSALKGRRVVSFPVERLPLEKVEGVVEGQWGTITILLRTPGSVVVEFFGDEASRYEVWTYAMGHNGTELQNVDLDDSNVGSVLVTEIDSVAVIIGRTSLSSGNFEISARKLTPTIAGTAFSEEDLLRQKTAFPNPFNAIVNIPIVSTDETVEFEVYNALGQLVRTLRKPVLDARVIVWDGRDDDGGQVASGVYTIVKATEKSLSGMDASEYTRVTLLR